MKRIPTIGLSLVLATAACNGRTPPRRPLPTRPRGRGSPPIEAARFAAQRRTRPPPPAGARRPLRLRGLVGMFFRAAHDADLSDDQKATIAKLEEPFQGDCGSHREISALHADLVASVKDGKIDSAKIARRRGRRRQDARRLARRSRRRRSRASTMR